MGTWPSTHSLPTPQALNSCSRGAPASSGDLSCCPPQPGCSVTHIDTLHCSQGKNPLSPPGAQIPTATQPPSTPSREPLGLLSPQQPANLASPLRVGRSSSSLVLGPATGPGSCFLEEGAPKAPQDGGRGVPTTSRLLRGGSCGQVVL